MPELPEVETVARQLAPLLAGQRIMQVRVFDPKLAQNSLAEGKLTSLEGLRISAVRRIGKQVAWTVSDEQEQGTVLIHLRMSGRLLWRGLDSNAEVVVPDQLVHQPADSKKHLRLRLECEAGELDFIDPRRFGTCAVYASGSTMPAIGVDPLSAEFTASALAALLAAVRQPIKPWLLRQDRIVGLGNIYASEILFRSGVSPFRAAGSLSTEEIARLHEQVRQTLHEAIEMCGTTFSDFQQSNGEQGGFQKFLTVYEREGQECIRCNAPILRAVQGGRSTYHCAQCQA